LFLCLTALELSMCSIVADAVGVINASTSSSTMISMREEEGAFFVQDLCS